MFFSKIRVFLIVVSTLLFIIPSYAQDARPDAEKQAALVTEFEVNGLKVLVKRRPRSQTVAAGLFLRGGVQNQTLQTAGIENFALEAANEASAGFPRAALRRELARTGTSLNAGSNFDYSVLSLNTTRANFPRSWRIFTDIALNPTFAPEDVERVRERLLVGLRESTSDPDSYLEILGRKYAYAGHPYANAPTGTIENVARFTVEDLRRYHRDLLQSSRLLLVIVGDLDAAELRSLVTASFGKLPRGSYQAKPLNTLSFTEPLVEITQRNLPTNYVQGVYAAPPINSPDIYPMQVATAILRDRVFEEVRERRNLSYAPGAFLHSFGANTGGIYVSAVDANQAVAVMLAEVAKLQTETVEAREISGVSGQYLTTYYLGQETNTAQAGELAQYELVGGGWRNSIGVLNRIREVKPEDVRRVARQYMRNIRFVVLGNPATINKEVFTRQLSFLEPGITARTPVAVRANRGSR